MSKAIELAKILEQYTSVSKNGKLMAATELRRLAAIEQKYLAIMAQEPFGYVPSYYKKASENGLGFVQCHGEELEGLCVQPVFVLPKPDQPLASVLLFV